MSDVSIIVLGDVEIETIVMRDPQATDATSITEQTTVTSGRDAYFYFRMPGGTWLLHRMIGCALGREIDLQQGPPFPDIHSFVDIWESTARPSNAEDRRAAVSLATADARRCRQIPGGSPAQLVQCL